MALKMPQLSDRFCDPLRFAESQESEVFCFGRLAGPGNGDEIYEGGEIAGSA